MRCVAWSFCNGMVEKIMKAQAEICTLSLEETGNIWIYSSESIHILSGIK
jgi:hypothetical protein